jgi:hypothetical protein
MFNALCLVSQVRDVVVLSDGKDGSVTQALLTFWLKFDTLDALYDLEHFHVSQSCCINNKSVN